MYASASKVATSKTKDSHENKILWDLFFEKLQSYILCLEMRFVNYELQRQLFNAIILRKMRKEILSEFLRSMYSIFPESMASELLSLQMRSEFSYG